MRSRVLISIILVALALAYLAWWQFIASTMKDRFNALSAAAKGRGWTVDSGAVTADGFPFAVRLGLAAPGFSDGSGTVWQGPPASVTVRPWAPGRARVSLAGRHRLTIAGGETATDLTAAAADADLAFGPHGLESVALELAGLTVEGIEVGRAGLTLTRLAFAPAGFAEPSLALSLTASAIDLAAAPPPPMDRRLTTVSLAARVLGWLPAGPPKSAAEAWRSDGGTVEIEALTVDWKPLKLAGQGTLALDRDLQPILSSSCRIQGLGPAIDALAARQLIKPRDGAVAKLVLGLLARPAADGRPEVMVPLSVENRMLYVGPAALFKLPELMW